MELQTKIPLIKRSHNLINYESNLLLLGSCFAENIGDKLAYFKFKNTVNPFGILFHPLAIEKLISRAVNQETYSKEELFFLNERWHCFDAHSSLSSSSKEELLSRLNDAIDVTFQQIKNSTHVVITLGTAWVYRHIYSDEIVANCHKIPQKKFLKELLSVDEIVNSLEALVTLIKEINPKTSILFTVSPVRHLKDGFIENSRSKAHLLSAVHEIIDPRHQLHYFPSYEIMIDELRDYRFYKKDMIHPSSLAVNYIWDRFIEVWIAHDSIETMKLVDSIQKGLLHKPFNPNSNQHKDFLLKLSETIEDIQKHLPHIEF